ncbi:MAG: hypothetical protein M3Y07_12720, partial [Acidobacteriota bacterium]|nr:hypothetical protein [Acidobacteriota bacterium]
ITVGEIRLGTWGQITIGAKRKGVTVSTADGLIAATAIEHGLRLVTRNVKDFAVLGVPLTNPWEISARDA